MDPVGLAGSRSSRTLRAVERRAELGFGECAGDAAGPCRHVGFGLLVHVGVGDHVRDREPAAGAQHPGGFGDHLGLVAGEVDHAVGDDHVDALVRERQLLEVALDELDVLTPACAALARASSSISSVMSSPIALPVGRDAPGGDQHVGAGAGPEVEDVSPRGDRRPRSAPRSRATRSSPPSGTSSAAALVIQARRRTRRSSSAGLQSARRAAAAGSSARRSRSSRRPRRFAHARLADVGQLSHADSSFSASGIT